jgi:hypothetical protein
MPRVAGYGPANTSRKPKSAARAKQRTTRRARIKRAGGVASRVKRKL